MVDMAVAFGALANAGVKVLLHPILKVEDYQGNVLEQYTPAPPDDTNRVLSAAAAYLTSHILLDNNARTAAFGASSQLIIPNQVVSVKTGTTNDLRDNWTIGYTPKFLTVVWVGNNDNTPMSYLTSGVTGAAPIWNILMRRVLKDEKPIWPEKPEGVVSTEICSLSGLLPNPDRPCDTRNEFFIQGTQPTQIDSSYKDIWVAKDTQLPGYEGDLELKNHLVLSDPFTTDFCFSCPWPQSLPDPAKPDQPATGSAYPEQTVDMLQFLKSKKSP